MHVQPPGGPPAPEARRLRRALSLKYRPLAAVALAWAAAAGLVAGAPRPVAAAGPWTSYLRAYTWLDALADSSSVWGATLEAGLLRFDLGSRTFENIVREPGGLASNLTSSLAEDRSRRLWVGTLGSGLSYLSADRTRWNLVNAFDGLPSDSVNSIAPFGDTLFVGTTQGIALWDGRQITGTLPDGVNESPFASDHVRSLVLIGDSVWVATLNGLYLGRIGQGLTVWTDLSDGLPGRRVEYLATDGHELFAFDTTTVDGANMWGVPYRRTGSTWTRQGGLGGVRSLHSDRGVIMVVSGGGLHRWSGTAYVQIPGAPPSAGPLGNGAIPRLWLEPAVTPDGLIYGGNENGLYEQITTGPWTRLAPAQPPGNNVLNVAVEGSRVYVTTFAEGIGRLENGQWRRWILRCRTPGCDGDTTFISPFFTYAIQIDQVGRKWFHSWGSTDNPQEPGDVVRLDDFGDPDEFFHVTEWDDEYVNVRHTYGVASTLDENGGVWFGMDSAERENVDFIPIGIDYYDAAGNFRRNMSPTNTGDPITRVNSLRTGRILALAYSRGYVWVGTTGKGIQRTSWQPDTVETSPQFLNVTSDAIDVRGLVAHGDTVWAQSTNDVRAYRASGSALLLGIYPVLAAPADDAPHPIEIVSDGTIWAGTVNGIRVYRPDGSVKQDISTANSPLGSDEVRAIRSDPATGVVWIATAAGLHRYDLRYVPPPPADVPRLEARVYPNPSRITSIGFRLSVAGNVGTYHGGVYDLTGRRVHEFSGVANQSVFWDGRDHTGRLVQPGVYFMRVESGSRSATVRIAILH